MGTKQGAGDPRPAAARMRLRILGAVQGVGFRPFVYRLAEELGLAGWVRNSAQGVWIEAEGPPSDLEGFLLRLQAERPPRASIQSLESTYLDPLGLPGFEIRPSEDGGAPSALVLPDIAPCPDCLREIFDPSDRRFRYPFTNCTNCGPRYSILNALPYDRPNTTMNGFAMCARCRDEYGDPRDRRFHAQPNACPDCGPRLELRDREGAALASGDEALLQAAEAVRDGAIVAVKGIGGYHLVADAGKEEAVWVLRHRKGREEKPFALMVPSLMEAEELCEVSDLEARLMLAPECPIVLLRRRGPTPPVRDPRFGIASSVAPGNPNLGIMLPPSPLHALLTAELGIPIVATSGNRSDEPICTEEREALDRLGGIAEVFLVHDRPIARHVDDSVVRMMGGREMVLRRARGYAPLPVPLRGPRASGPVLAVGAHQKNAVALSLDGKAFVSQHIGDLDTPESLRAFHRTVEGLQGLYAAEPVAVACDAHPDYTSTRAAEVTGLPIVRVQHHHAHLLSGMAENELDPPVLGVAWDGTGHGTDGTIWGGEFLRVTDASFLRVARLRTFPLPGGERATREPRRSALGLLHEHAGAGCFEAYGGLLRRWFEEEELRLLRGALKGGVNTPVTSSVGRLFDGVAALAGIRARARFEGQAAMELEFALGGTDTEEAYPLPLAEGPGTRPSGPSTPDGFRGIEGHRGAGPASPPILDWGPLLEAILHDLDRGTPVGALSARFHNALAEAVVAVARRFGEDRVLMSGGCFQNRYLTERTVKLLRKDGIRPYWHQRIPPNDGGIALGQIVAAGRKPMPA